MSKNEFIDYQKIIKENISIAKNLANIPDDKKEEVKKLLLKKYIIQEKNGFLAEFKIKIINKKISKIREENNEKKEIY